MGCARSSKHLNQVHETVLWELWLTSCDGDWQKENWPIPVGMAGSRRTATRVTPGAICLSSSNHFPARLYSNGVKPVTLPPGRAKLSTNDREHNRHGAGRLEQRPHGRAAMRQNGVRRERYQSAACLRMSAASGCGPARVDPQLRPWSSLGAPAPDGTPRPGLNSAIVRGCGRSTPMRRTRSGCCARAVSGHATSRTAEQRYELSATDHSMTSSARASSDGGTSRPSMLSGLGVDDQLELYLIAQPAGPRASCL